MHLIFQMCFDQFIYFLQKRVSKSQERKCEVKRPAGGIHSVFTKETHTHTGWHGVELECYVWSFNLHTSLRLSLKFYHISIQYVNLQNCIMGHVAVIFNKGDPCGRCKYYQPFYKKTEHNFRYCGTHSFLVNYLSERMIKLELAVVVPAKADVMMSYLVIDSHIASSKPVDYHADPHIIWVVVFPQSKMTACKYFVKTKKFNRLQLLIQRKGVVRIAVWDGPGFLSTQLQAVHTHLNFTVFWSRTFQCTLILLAVSSLQSYNGLQYTAVRNDILNTVFVNKTQSVTITFSDPSNFQSAWILQLVSAQHMRLNISVNHYIYHGVANWMCQFAGISAYDVITETLTEFSSICHSAPGYKHRNIYSTNSSILLVLYVYPEYGQVSISFGVQSTTCQVFSLNLCLFGALYNPGISSTTKQTVSPRFFPVCKNRKYPSFLSNSGCKTGKFDLSVKPGDCHVIQMHYDEGHRVKPLSGRYSWYCYIGHLKHQHVTGISRKIHYKLSGFLRGKSLCSSVLCWLEKRKKLSTFCEWTPCYLLAKSTIFCLLWRWVNSLGNSRICFLLLFCSPQETVPTC